MDTGLMARLPKWISKFVRTSVDYLAIDHCDDHISSHHSWLLEPCRASLEHAAIGSPIFPASRNTSSPLTGFTRIARHISRKHSLSPFNDETRLLFKLFDISKLADRRFGKPADG